MNTKNPKLQNILRQYDRQMNKTSKLARIQQVLQGAPDQSAASSGKREKLVQNISREIINNLLTSNSQNPVVQEIRHELEQEFDTTFCFEFLPKENRVQIRKANQHPVDDLEQEQILQKLWNITRKKVDQTMI